MFEIVRAIHEAIRSESTWAFVLVISTSFALTSGVVAYIVDRGYKNKAQEIQEEQERRTELTVVVTPTKIIRVINTGTRTIRSLKVWQTDYELNPVFLRSGHLALKSYSKVSGPIAAFDEIQPTDTEMLDLIRAPLMKFVVPTKGAEITGTLANVYCLRFEFQSAGRGYVLYRTVSSTVGVPSFLDDEVGVGGTTALDYMYDIPEFLRKHQKHLFPDANLQDVSPTRPQ